MEEIKQVIHPTELLMSEEELVKFQLRWIFRDKAFINEKELLTLSYVFLHKNLAPAKMVENKLTVSEKSIENIISTFRKKGFIAGYGEDTSLHPGIKPILSNVDFTIKLRLK